MWVCACQPAPHTGEGFVEDESESFRLYGIGQILRVLILFRRILPAAASRCLGPVAVATRFAEW